MSPAEWKPLEGMWSWSGTAVSHWCACIASLARAITGLLSLTAVQAPAPITLCRIPESTQATATFLAKADGVLAGLGVADEVLAIVDPTVKVGLRLVQLGARACD